MFRGCQTATNVMPVTIGAGRYRPHFRVAPKETSKIYQKPLNSEMTCNASVEVVVKDTMCLPDKVQLPESLSSFKLVVRPSKDLKATHRFILINEDRTAVETGFAIFPGCTKMSRQLPPGNYGLIASDELQVNCNIQTKLDKAPSTSAQPGFIMCSCNQAFHSPLNLRRCQTRHPETGPVNDTKVVKITDPSELYPHLAKWWSTAHVGEVQSLLLLSISDEELDALHRLNPEKAQKCRTERAVLERLVMGFGDAVSAMKRKSRQRRSWGYLLRLALGNCQMKPDLRILLKRLRSASEGTCQLALTSVTPADAQDPRNVGAVIAMFIEDRLRARDKNLASFPSMVEPGQASHAAPYPWLWPPYMPSRGFWPYLALPPYPPYMPFVPRQLGQVSRSDIPGPCMVAAQTLPAKPTDPLDEPPSVTAVPSTQEPFKIPAVSPKPAQGASSDDTSESFTIPAVYPNPAQRPSRRYELSDPPVHAEKLDIKTPACARIDVPPKDVSSPVIVDFEDSPASTAVPLDNVKDAAGSRPLSVEANIGPEYTELQKMFNKMTSNRDQDAANAKPAAS